MAVIYPITKDGVGSEVFDEQVLTGLSGGKAAIGNVRYTTASDRMYANAQPLVTNIKVVPWRWLMMADWSMEI